MQLRITKFLGYIAIVGMTALFSCTEPCADADCGTYGACTEIDAEGVCLCTNGYEQNTSGQCEIRSTDKFVGVWNATEQCTDNITNATFTFEYEVDVTASESEITRIFMDNLGALTCTNSSTVEVTATVAGTSLTIDEATYCPDTDNDFSGFAFARTAGTYDETAGTISLTYQVSWTDGADDFDFECTVVMEPK